MKVVIQGGTITGICFTNEAMKATFLNIFWKRCLENIHIELAGVNQKEDLQTFKKMIDVIPYEKIESNLNCQEYVYMYCMLRGSYDDTIEGKLESIMEQLGIKYLKDWKMFELTIEYQMLIRSISAYIIGCSLLIFQSNIFLEKSIEKEKLVAFLKYYKKRKGICLVLSLQMEKVSDFIDIFYNIE